MRIRIRNTAYVRVSDPDPDMVPDPNMVPDTNIYPDTDRDMDPNANGSVDPEPYPSRQKLSPKSKKI